MEETQKPMGWKELYLKEDWWAIYLGLGIVIAAIAFFYTGNPFLKSLSILPPAWIGSSRGEAGVCSKRDLFLSPNKKCKYFESTSRAPSLNGSSVSTHDKSSEGP